MDAAEPLKGITKAVCLPNSFFRRMEAAWGGGLLRHFSPLPHS